MGVGLQLDNSYKQDEKLNRAGPLFQIRDRSPRIKTRLDTFMPRSNLVYKGTQLTYDFQS